MSETLPLNLMEYESLARARMEGSAWDFFEGGSEDEVTLAENRAAFRRVSLRPRVLVGANSADMRTTALGVPLRCPVMVAPIGYQGLAHPDGECAMARVAGTFGTLMVVSTMSNRRLEDIAAAASGPLWFQLYAMKDRALTASLIERAGAAGYRAIVLTVDTPRMGRRERDMRNGFVLPASLVPANLPLDPSSPVHQRAEGASAIARHVHHAFDDAASWETVSWIMRCTRLPVVLKGVLTGEDAARAAREGVAGLVVSNHGGRQLDGAPATLDVLEEVAEAAGASCEIYVDGGIRRGTDVLKARALGARAVLLGRPMLWGLSSRGEAGGVHVLELLRAEIEHAMMLAGRLRWDDIDQSLIRRA